MANPTDKKFTHLANKSSIFPVNKYVDPNYTIQVDAGVWLIEGTLNNVNDPKDTPDPQDNAIWHTITSRDGIPLSGLSAGYYPVEYTGFQAVRLTSTAAGVVRIANYGS